MAEWLYEAGIGETRAALIEDGRIVEARIEREGEGPRVGAILTARLVEPGRLSLDAPGEPVATIAAPGVPLGSRLTVEITRMALRERGRDKPA
ncbi:MAG: ribonuclease, partial [Sphingopyxis granuli]